MADQFFDEHAEDVGDMGPVEAEMEAFVARAKAAGRPVVVIGSGGTSVPLERRTVRSLENFSAGTRGATSAEVFLAHGYSVLFLNRRHSVQPYLRLVTKSLTDLLDVDEEGKRVYLSETASEDDGHLARVMTVAKAVERDGRLLKVEFVTLADYLFKLRAACHALRAVGKMGAVYAATAVSDYFIPKADMAEHKIQSGPSTFTLELRATPKMLGAVPEWGPELFVCSFKLETDEDILVSKAKGAIAKYKPHVVVGNILHTRKDQVLIVTEADVQTIRRTEAQIAEDVEIEKELVGSIVSMHARHIGDA